MGPSVWIISARLAAVSRPFSHAETMEVSMRIVPLWVHTPRSARSTQNEHHPDLKRHQLQLNFRRFPRAIAASEPTHRPQFTETAEMRPP